MERYASRPRDSATAEAKLDELFSVNEREDKALADLGKEYPEFRD